VSIIFFASSDLPAELSVCFPFHPYPTTATAIAINDKRNGPTHTTTGQFHVGVQEEVIQELTRFEDVAYNYLESPSKYFQTRAKLVAKVRCRGRGRLCVCRVLWWWWGGMGWGI
jgi:hypothetical protein